jgi:predicted secreted protein
MAVINGTTMLLYSGGVAIAVQRGLSIGVNLNLDDATNKESAGWGNHISGLLNASIDFDALYSADVASVMSADDLMDYILTRGHLLISILGLGYPIVGEADMSSLKFNAPLEQAMSLSGSLKVNGQLFVLSGAKEYGTGNMNNLVTDPDGTSSTYDTMTVSGIKITSAIVAAGGPSVISNGFAVTIGATYKLIFFLTSNSGSLPSVRISKTDGSSQSNAVACTAGINVITLIPTANVTPALHFYNSGACNWSTSNIYLFKV